MEPLNVTIDECSSEGGLKELSRRQIIVVIDGLLTLRYGDPAFERKLRSAPNLRILSIDGLPAGTKLRHGVEEKGFYFWFDDGSGELKRYFYPAGLKEIRVNGQYIDVEQEWKWLIESHMARYGVGVAGFWSLTADLGVRELFSYYAKLAKMPDPKLEFLFKVLCKAAKDSTDPYFGIYLSDVTMARLLRSVTGAANKRRQPVTPSNMAPYVEAVLVVLETIASDARNQLGQKDTGAGGGQLLGLSGHMRRLDPIAFWTGARDQASVRENLLREALPDVRSGYVLDLLSGAERLEFTPPNLPIAGGQRHHRSFDQAGAVQSRPGAVTVL